MTAYLTKSSNDPIFNGWHCPRPQMAESYLKTLSSGVMLSTTVYAPSQTGLSNFFINDIIPCSQENKYVTVYVDLSDPLIPVTAAMLVSLERELMGTSVFRSGFNLVKGFFHHKEPTDCRREKYKNNNTIIDQLYFKENIKEHLSLIDKHFDRMCEYGSVLVIIDHVHNLNKDDVGIVFCKYFADLITRKKHCLKPLYGTSDLNKWRTVFDNRYSSLHSEGAFIHKLPTLGKFFVREAVLRSGHSIGMDEAVKCYEVADYKPGIFMALLISWKPESGTSFFQHCVENLTQSPEQVSSSPEKV